MNEELANRRRQPRLDAGRQIEIITDAASLPRIQAKWIHMPDPGARDGLGMRPGHAVTSPINPQTLVSSSVRALCRNARFSPCLPSPTVTVAEKPKPAFRRCIGNQCRRGLHARVDLRMAERTVTAVFPAAIETIHAGYWKSSSRAAINEWHSRRFHRVRPGGASAGLQ